MEKYVDGSVGARVRMMMRGDTLPVRMNSSVRWMYEDTSCVCGEEETEAHVMCECRLYDKERADWITEWKKEMNDMNVLNGVLGHVEMSERIERMIHKEWEMYGEQEKRMRKEEESDGTKKVKVLPGT